MDKKDQCMDRFGNPEYHEWLPFETYRGVEHYEGVPTGEHYATVTKVFCRWCLEVREIKG